jgi:hypothetical protein
MVPVEFQYALSRDGKVIHESEPTTIEVRSNQKSTIQGDLGTFDTPGKYTMETTFLFQGKTSEQSADFVVK